MYLRLNYTRTSPDIDGYMLMSHAVTDIKEEDNKKAIYYYVYEDDFFDRFPQRCSIALEKGDLTDEEYKEKCVALDVYDTEPTDIIAKEVIEKTVYVEYTDENIAKLNALYNLGNNVTIEDYKDYLKTIVKEYYKRKLKTKTPFKTSDGTVIDFSSAHIADLEQIIRVIDGNFNFRVYNNTFMGIDRNTAEKWLCELIQHEILLRNEQWSYLNAIDKATSYTTLEHIRRSVLDGDISE